MRETAGTYRGALRVIAGAMAVSTVLRILVHPPRKRDIGTTEKARRVSRKVAVINWRVSIREFKQTSYLGRSIGRLLRPR
jgi:hypothetical protein